MPRSRVAHITSWSLSSTTVSPPVPPPPNSSYTCAPLYCLFPLQSGWLRLPTTANYIIWLQQRHLHKSSLFPHPSFKNSYSFCTPSCALLHSSVVPCCPILHYLSHTPVPLLPHPHVFPIAPPCASLMHVLLSPLVPHAPSPLPHHPLAPYTLHMPPAAPIVSFMPLATIVAEHLTHRLTPHPLLVPDTPPVPGCNTVPLVLPSCTPLHSLLAPQGTPMQSDRLWVSSTVNYITPFHKSN